MVMSCFKRNLPIGGPGLHQVLLHGIVGGWDGDRHNLAILVVDGHRFLESIIVEVFKSGRGVPVKRSRDKIPIVLAVLEVLKLEN